MLCGSRITAAATTGPAQGPRPASSTPQGISPSDNAACSKLKSGEDMGLGMPQRPA